jgi:hypothetical protein
MVHPWLGLVEVVMVPEVMLHPSVALEVVGEHLMMALEVVGEHLMMAILCLFSHHLADSYGLPHLWWVKLYP